MADSPMLLRDLWKVVAEKVFPTPSSPTLFNMYLDEDPLLDQPGAAMIRRQNLHNYMACYTHRPEFFLLAEAPGPWGCRFSGVPIVSERQLVDSDFPVSGAATARADAPYSEYSARIFWRQMKPLFPRFFVWNTVPYHPHRRGQPTSIRTPTAREVAAGARIAGELWKHLGAGQVLAIGRKAERACSHIGIDATYIRHPSQGGARLFAAGIQQAFAN